MNLKTILLTAAISALSASAVNGLQFASGSAEVQPYTLWDVYAWAQIESPIENESYLESLVYFECQCSVKRVCVCLKPWRNSISRHNLCLQPR